MYIEKEYNPHTEKETLKDKYRAVILGGVIGDTLGMPIEGWTREQIQKYVGSVTKPVDPILVKDINGNTLYKDEHGPILYISSNYKKGQWTDDTALALATARSIVDSSGLNLENHVQHCLKVYEERNALMHVGTVGNFGDTTKRAFENLKQGISPQESGIMAKYPGNAPALKISPVGLYMHRTGRYDEGLNFAYAAGIMTHKDWRSITSGIVQAHAIYALLYGVSRDIFLESIVEVSDKWERSKEQGKKVLLSDRLAWILANKDVDEETAYKELGSSFVVTKSYPFTIFMFQKYWDNSLEGLLKTVNYGGDADSNGAIYGALAGAKDGMIFPANWIQLLEAKEELTYLADKISSLKICIIN